jgi:uncharacterized protein YjbI with pentapeptide repeats
MQEETERSPAAESEEQSRRGPRWVVLFAALALVGVAGVIIYGYLERPGWIGVSGKKLWDYLELLIVPAALALGVYWLNQSQHKRDQQAEALREREREAAEEGRRKRELEVENQRAQDAALQGYLDQMTRLLLNKDMPLRESKEGDEVRILARARTLTVLSRLDPVRKRSLLDFLYRTDLINNEYFTYSPESNEIDIEQTIVDLDEADLSKMYLASPNLRGANLRTTNLGEAILYKADLRDAGLSGATMEKAELFSANLTGADLRNTNLKGALLVGTDLREALVMGANLEDANLTFAKLIGSNLESAILSGADLTSADLSNAILSNEVWLVDAKLRSTNLANANLNGAYMNGADLSDANLRGADLRNVLLIEGANLSGADLTNANLSGAIGATQERLAQAKSLEGATMADGQKYEVWLKSQGRKEDGENE